MSILYRIEGMKIKNQVSRYRNVVIKLLTLMVLAINSESIQGQSTYLLSNVQLNNMLDNSTYPSEIGFHLASRVSFGVQVPLCYDTITQKERFAVELGIGGLLNSMYFKTTKNITSENKVKGMFFKVEPIFNILQNKSRSLFLQASLNNVLFLFPKYETGKGYYDADTNEIILKTTNTSSKLQYLFEPYLGVTYLLNFKKSGGGLIFRLKRGFVFHEKAIAFMQFDNSNRVYDVKLNNNSWNFSIGYRIKTKK
jgi:hypothetical protein